VFAEAFGLGEFADDVPGLFTGQHEFHDNYFNAETLRHRDKRRAYATTASWWNGTGNLTKRR
jgi:hypothetical protein